MWTIEKTVAAAPSSASASTSSSNSYSNETVSTESASGGTTAERLGESTSGTSTYVQNGARTSRQSGLAEASGSTEANETGRSWTNYASHTDSGDTAGEGAYRSGGTQVDGGGGSSASDTDITNLLPWGAPPASATDSSSSSSSSSAPVGATTGAPFVLATTASGTGGSTQSAYTVTTSAGTTVPTLTGTGTARAPDETTATTTILTTTADTDHLLPGVYPTTTTAGWAVGASVGVDHYLFEPGEEAWQLRRAESFEGMKLLTQIGTRLSDRYQPPDSSTQTVSRGLTPTQTFAGVTRGLDNGTITQYSEGVSHDTTSGSAAALAEPPQRLSNDTAGQSYLPQHRTSTSSTGGGPVDSVTSQTSSVHGSSTSSAASFILPQTTAGTTLALDDRGRVTGSRTLVVATQSVRTLAQEFAATTGGDAVQTSGSSTTTSSATGTHQEFDRNDDSLTGHAEEAFGQSTQQQSGSGSTLASGQTFTIPGDPVYSASSFAAAATILEATFDPAVRLGTSGKLSVVDGPASQWPYPWWSQVWGGLYEPMTYRDARTALFQDRTTTQYGSDTYLVETGPQKSASYQWSSDGGVSITTASGTGTQTASGSTSFTPQAGASDSRTYFAQRGANGDGVYVAGGTQWNDQPAQLWLGRGIWQFTSYAGTGSSTGQETVTGDVSIRSLDSSVVVAARPVPAWECVSASPADLCLVILTPPIE